MKILIIFLTLIYSSFGGRYNFSTGFRFGAATASYQIEGAWDADGKLPNIWDTASHKSPSIIRGGATGDDAAKSYEFYMKDVQALKDANFTVYRFSISWTRVLKKNQQVNQAGIDYYNSLINALKAENIEPMVTIFHWDLPQYLQDLGGWTNRNIIKYFEIYADLLFKTYGDRVKEWITFNEPSVFCDLGYSWASHAPHIATYRQIGGNLCSHHVLLSHARAYHIYQEKYAATQGGKVGICLNSGHSYPANENVTSDTIDKAIQFSLGRYANPIFTAEGDYPQVMREAIDRKSEEEGRRWSRLPKFTDEEIAYVRGTADFLALNYYSSGLVEPAADPQWSDNEIDGSFDPNWKTGNLTWLRQVPEGLRDHLGWIKDHYNNVLVYVTENGWADWPMEIEDYGRVEYLTLHLKAISEAIWEFGCNVKAYTVWSLVDNFEWMEGYDQRFGIYAINFTDPDRPRIPKLSVDIFKNLARDGYIEVVDGQFD